MELLFRLLILQCHPRKRKISIPSLKKMNIHCCSLKAEDDALFNNMSKIPAFVLSPLKSILNSEVDRLSLRQLEYDMDRTNYPIDYNCFEIGYCGHPKFPYAHTQLKQATNLIMSYFQEEDHSLNHNTLKNRKTNLVSLYFDYRHKKN